jgi:hypothetical protein
VFVAGHGTSFDQPIEVLFVEEEYVFLASLGLKMREQALGKHGGHHFDVITTVRTPAHPEAKFYFNIDSPWKSLEASLGKVFEDSRKAGAQK